jgi:hypothetical protein
MQTPSAPRDFVGLFLQVDGSPVDSLRPRQTVRISLTRKRSLVQIQYGPPGISCSRPYQVRSVALQLTLQRALCWSLRLRAAYLFDHPPPLR